MRYRDAKQLKQGDIIIRKRDGMELVVKDATAYGQHKVVMIGAETKDGNVVLLFQEEVE